MINDYRKLAQLFTSSHLKELSRGNFDLVNQVHKFFFESHENLSIANLFDESFKLLSNKYPNEYIYKNLIIEQLFLKKYDYDIATFLTEFRVGDRKADCVVLNGKSTCYEIKTEFDSLLRLDLQLKEYEQIFDEVYVVCATKFTQKLLNQLPENIGIFEYNSNFSFKKIRKSKIQKDSINKKLLMQTLRQSEFKQLASQISKKNIDVPNTEVFDHCSNIIQQYDNNKKLNKLFIDILKKQRKNDEELIKSFPKSLTNALISYNLLKSDLNNLREIMTINYGKNHYVLPYTTWQTTRIFCS